MFAYLLRPLVESHFEVRTDQAVGDLPRKSDIVLLRKTATGPTPFKGLWSRLTTWNVLEYKGPTESPRFDELHDMLELGLGMHRRLNEMQRKAKQPEVSYAEVSFWYLVNHIGRRFVGDLPGYLPGIRQQADGIWLASVYRHPVFLVSVQDLEIERDSLPLHVLAGVPDEDKGAVAEVLKREPRLWPSYGSWLSAHDPAIWQEITHMAAQQGEHITYDPVGFKQVLEAMGPDTVLETILGMEHFLARVSPEKREKLRRALEQQDNPDKPNDPT
jgi:hypothetical protein